MSTSRIPMSFKLHSFAFKLIRVAGVATIVLVSPIQATLLAQGAARPVAVVRARPNDNRIPAGTPAAGNWKLAIEARMAEWKPHGDSGPGVSVPAFAEVGKAPTIPGPLLRVKTGALVYVTVRNALSNDTLRVHGLYARPLAAAVDSAPLVLAPGETRAVTFRLDAPGTFYYWGTTTKRALVFRTGLDAQLTGAIVVDSPTANVRDRVFVIGMWTDTVARSFLHRKRVLGVVNGRSWPNTEMLSATVGDSVRWRVINASGDLHPMHLHGFFFRVTARGDGTTDTLLTPNRSALEVTEAMTMGATYSMTWVPERAGNWLYHCHIPEHFEARGPLGLARAASTTSTTTSHGSHANDEMSGLVLGVAVKEASARRKTIGSSETSQPSRALRLLVRPSLGSTATTPWYSYAWHENGPEPKIDSGLVASPPLVLTRGQLVQITVVNRLSEPTAVHWHGIELDSYYDGVPGFSGAGKTRSPLTAPSDSFVVRFTPPRAGTFIYHTHHDENRQQAAGLAAPIIVLNPGERFDPAHDHSILVSSPADEVAASGVVLMNATNQPAPLTLRVGETMRVRIINMTLRRSGIRVRLAQGATGVPLRIVAKDGAAVPQAIAQSPPMAQLLSIGETIDVMVTAETVGDLNLQFRVGPLNEARLLGTYPIRVVP